MKIINLIEDTCSSNGCAFEHGLSFYIETQRHRLLADTGATEAFLLNAAKLGINLHKVDTVIISHGHYDHGGGIMAFTALNPTADIYIRENAFQSFWHMTEGHQKYIGLDREIKGLRQLIKVKEKLIIDEELALFTGTPAGKNRPSGNLELLREGPRGLEQDDFSHEQYLCLSCEGKKILISGCAHNGILNILEAYSTFMGGAPDLVISGFHMSKKGGLTAADTAVIEDTARKLAKMHTRFYTCHCTGEDAYSIMKSIMGGQISYVRSGEQILV